jgi:hypothetical protein
MKTATAVLVLGTCFALTPTSASSDAIRRLLNKLEGFKDHSWIGAELQDVVAVRRRSLQRAEKTTSTYGGVRKRGTGGTRQLKKGKAEKKGKSDGDPESCCDFLAELSARDVSCFNIVRRAEIVSISEDDAFDCVADLEMAKKGSEDDLMSRLADQYEDASDSYINFIDAALAGEFDNVESSCFDTTPSTFTFACEADAATVTDDVADYTAVDSTLVDFYAVPDVLGDDGVDDDDDTTPSTPTTPTSAPVTTPTTAPVTAPTTAVVTTPTAAPVTTPTEAPVAPTTAPVAPTNAPA